MPCMLWALATSARVVVGGGYSAALVAWLDKPESIRSSNSTVHDLLGCQLANAEVPGRGTDFLRHCLCE